MKIIAFAGRELSGRSSAAYLAYHYLSGYGQQDAAEIVKMAARQKMINQLPKEMRVGNYKIVREINDFTEQAKIYGSGGIIINVVRPFFMRYPQYTHVLGADTFGVPVALGWEDKEKYRELRSLRGDMNTQLEHASTLYNIGSEGYLYEQLKGALNEHFSIGSNSGELSKLAKELR